MQETTATDGDKGSHDVLSVFSIAVKLPQECRDCLLLTTDRLTCVVKLSQVYHKALQLCKFGLDGLAQAAGLVKLGIH